MDITKKLTGVLTAVMVAATVFGFVMLPTAQALTTQQMDSILNLLASFGASQDVIDDVNSALNGEPTSGNNGGGSSSSCDTYGTSNLVYVGMRGDNVRAIQRAMNQILDLSGGSMAPLAVDGIFGPLTKGVVQYFQGIISTPADGIWGPNTQAAYLDYVSDNCSEGSSNNGSSNNNSGSGDGEIDAVSMNGGSIATGGNANVFAFEISAGEDDLEIDDITFTRYGNSVNSNWENLKVVDADGVALTSAGTLNSGNKVKLTFTPNIEVESGESAMYYLRAGATSGATNGQSARFGIASMSDIDFVGSPEVDGSFPVQGPSFEILSLSIGSLTATNDGSVSDVTPDVGDENVVVNKFKLSAGSTEDVTIESIQVERKGSASADDTVNIELYSRTDNETIATVDEWDPQGYATFSNLDMVIEEGDNHRFEIRVDIVDGTGLEVNADLTDGDSSTADVRVMAMGNDYGYYITPGISGSWNGKGSSNQTINSGALTVAKSSATPATGNVTTGDERLVGVFDLITEGEGLQITSFKVSFDLGTMSDSEISNARIANYETGETLGGPNDVSTTNYDPQSGSDYEATATFTDTFEIDAGTTQVAVYVDISDDASANDTIHAAIADAADDITAKGLSSNDSVTASPSTSEVNGNELTVRAGALSATTLTSPSARNVVVGAQDFVFATFNLSAANSGEDIEVTAVILEDTLGDAGDDADTIDNVEIWADLEGTGSDSVRGDRYETRVSNTEQFSDSGATDETLSITLSETVVVEKDKEVRLAVVADLASGATAGDTHTISLDQASGAVTATGADTGNSLSITPSNGGQMMTVDAGGALTVSVDSSSPSAAVLLDDAQDGKVTVGIFRLAASNEESLDLDSFKITDDGSDSAVDTYYFQAMSKSGSAIGPEKAVVGGATAEAFWTDGQVTVPANDYILMYVKAMTSDVDSSAASNEDTVQVTVAASGDVDTTGNASGSAVDSTATSVDAGAHYMFQAYPTFEWLTVANTTLTQNVNHLVGKLKITANGDEDVSFLSGSTSEIYFQATVVGDDDDAATENITFKDGDGTTLDVATFTGTSTTNNLQVDFSSAALTIAPGQSDTIFIYADTSDLEGDNDTFQLWLDNSDIDDLSWAIDGSGDFNGQAGILWRSDYMSDQYAQLHINPS
jgi:peptidoglycan hydrolase-like protein with peptidoglycan-binding domain